jgi:hypothetical protein
MTKEEKQLLLQDLCTRLPYGVFCVGTTYELDDDGERYIPVKVKDTLTEIHNYKLETASVRLGLISSCKLETVKPYLRPMSSMTEEELYEIQEILGKGVEIRDVFITIVDSSIDTFSYLELQAVFDWLNKNMFDYLGLLERGLAISVTKDNNPYKE